MSSPPPQHHKQPNHDSKIPPSKKRIQHRHSLPPPTTLPLTPSRAHRFSSLPGREEYTPNLYTPEGVKLYKNSQHRQTVLQRLRDWQAKERMRMRFAVPWRIALFWAFLWYCYSFASLEKYYRYPGERFSGGWAFGFER